MSLQWYRLGLLLVVFGGFLAVNSSGGPAGLGIGAMVLGLVVGLVGIVSMGSESGSGRA